MKLCTHTQYDNLDTHKIVHVNSTKKIDLMWIGDLSTKSVSMNIFFLIR